MFTASLQCLLDQQEATGLSLPLEACRMLGPMVADILRVVAGQPRSLLTSQTTAFM